MLRATLRTQSVDGERGSMWDQLTPADFRRARHILNLRRADTLRRHGKEMAELQMRQAEEIKLLDEKHAQIDDLELTVERFIRDSHLIVRVYAKVNRR